MKRGDGGAEMSFQTKRTDTEILDWMQREGLESIVRCPQFTSKGAATGICIWASHWTPDQRYMTLREAAMAGMDEAEK